jgi:acyl-homoserine-lactone acylase
MKRLFLLILLPLNVLAQLSEEEVNGWEHRSKNVTIIRDKWGIPHIYGKTDADVVFGLMYAQCEDDFKRVEMNYIEKLGRMAEVRGISELNNDLKYRLAIDAADAKNDYAKCPPYLQKLMIAFADGINFFLYKNPNLTPALITKFEPWFPLLWTNGSIDNITTAGVTADEMGRFYDDVKFTGFIPRINKEEEYANGSNAFAIAPALSATNNALLYINPHVTFFFRPEVHMVSEEGLNAYGAVTWGQFFLYHGFNEHLGWMHTSSRVDAADLYIENVKKAGSGWTYKYNGAVKPVIQKEITINYIDNGSMNTKTIKALFTGHGPVVAQRNGKWLSLKANNRSIDALVQSWKRTKATTLADFKKTLELLSNNSDNTMYADDKGNIAYWHGNFIPVRDKKYDWNQPVDGTVSATEWKGVHPLNEIVQSVNPPNGWLQNCNSSPFKAAGDFSPKKELYPSYMAPEGENFRSLHALKILKTEKKYTLEKLIAKGYDNYAGAFEVFIPALISAYEKSLLDNDSFYLQIDDVIQFLKGWDMRCSENSVATTIAVEWAEKLLPTINKDPETDQVLRTIRYLSTAEPQELLRPLAAVVEDLKHKFGRWEVEWGDVNRYQRVNADLGERFDDGQGSLPVGFVSATWGMLPSFGSIYQPGTTQRYGILGNSFICAVEFGKRVRAKSLLTGGVSGDPNSDHFSDQAEMFTKGQFKDVFFYKEDVLKNAERSYHPGE